MNVYQMYNKNEKQFGFFIERDNWVNTVAKVVSIADTVEGKPISAKYPYYGNKKVMAEFYDASSVDKCTPETYLNTSEVSCPGTFSYRMLSAETA